MRNYSVLEDKPVQCFLGSCSTVKNLDLIPKDKYPRVNPLQKKHKADIFAGLEQVMPPCYMEKVWEMIWKRWEIYEGFYDQREKK